MLFTILNFLLEKFQSDLTNMVASQFVYSWYNFCFCLVPYQIFFKVSQMLNFTNKELRVRGWAEILLVQRGEKAFSWLSSSVSIHKHSPLFLHPFKNHTIWVFPTSTFCFIPYPNPLTLITLFICFLCSLLVNWILAPHLDLYLTFLLLFTKIRYLIGLSHTTTKTRFFQ